jgi:UDP-glucose 4-epimerase
MLAHNFAEPVRPERVVILGAGGVIGAALSAHLEANGVSVLGLGSADVDLSADDAADRLAERLDAKDALVMLSALTPDKGRDIATFIKNLRMAVAVCGAIQTRPVSHVVYMSSDAVYPMIEGHISEDKAAQPPDLYGTMHYAREVMFRDVAKDMPLAILRCTLVLSSRDTHNSYGPNRFRGIGLDGGEITVGGEGEETRDHILDRDVAAIIGEVLSHRSYGLVNVATGTSHSFRQVADMVAACFDPPVPVKGSPRNFPVSHRHFDTTALLRAFPNLRLTPLDEAIRLVHQEVAG